uniref:Uncharacterized protein n=1 Tax=Globodera rostochiensis TaxID=31243 RepID=A0A914HRZ6_GLORO
MEQAIPEEQVCREQYIDKNGVKQFYEWILYKHNNHRTVYELYNIRLRLGKTMPPFEKPNSNNQLPQQPPQPPPQPQPEQRPVANEPPIPDERELWAQIVQEDGPEFIYQVFGNQRGRQIIADLATFVAEREMLEMEGPRVNDLQR